MHIFRGPEPHRWGCNDLIVNTISSEAGNPQAVDKKWKDFFIELKALYSYVYLPVELDVESFTKIETDEMQKIFDKKFGF